MEQIKKTEKIPGINCPNCGNFIQTSIPELLVAHSLRCPSCLLQLMIDKQQSRHALIALSKVNQAQQKVEQVRKQEL